MDEIEDVAEPLDESVDEEAKELLCHYQCKEGCIYCDVPFLIGLKDTCMTRCASIG